MKFLTRALSLCIDSLLCSENDDENGGDAEYEEEPVRMRHSPDIRVRKPLPPIPQDDAMQRSSRGSFPNSRPSSVNSIASNGGDQSPQSYSPVTRRQLGSATIFSKLGLGKASGCVMFGVSDTDEQINIHTSSISAPTDCCLIFF